MRLQLLGTGCSDGWPNPWCTCASCTAAADAGIVRGQTSALLDDRLLLDIGAEAPRAALRHGTSLAGVEVVLATHAHPDHHAWPAWMWRGWAPTRQPAHPGRPAAVLADCQQAPGRHREHVEVRAGDRLSVAGYDVVALRRRTPDRDAGPAVLYDVTAPDGRGCCGAATPASCPSRRGSWPAGRAYDVVLLELTSAHLPHHLDLRSWPLQVAALRSSGAVTDATHLLAVHLGHDNPPRPSSTGSSPGGVPARRSTARCSRSAPRTEDDAGSGARSCWAARARASRRTPSSSWPRSRRRLRRDGAAAADDGEWAQRVQAHVQRRPASWTTRETADVAGCSPRWRSRCWSTTWGCGWSASSTTPRAGTGRCPPPSSRRATRSCRPGPARRGTAVLVAPEVGGGVVPATASGRRFRDLLGALTARLAAGADDVVQVVAGLPRSLR
jgi:adenosylcobinamide kinase/adenosylcobinamide-phosphate guanylyltransferase